jgi:hypothetical protein
MAPKRPNITQTVRDVMRDVARRMPEFAHIDASRILVVAGEARRASHASVRPLSACANSRAPDRRRPARDRPVVRINGKQMLYCITLRPVFFRVETPEKRVETILHELFHISTRFDGSLHAGRRHSRLGRKFERRLRPLVRRYLKAMPEELFLSLSVNGVVSSRQWLEKPSLNPRPGPGARARRVYTERQVFVGPVRMITRGKRQPVPTSRLH